MDRRTTLQSLASGGVLLTTGCLSLVETDEPDPETLVRQAFSYEEEVTDVQGVRTVTAEMDGTTWSRTERFWERPPIHSRREVIDVSDPEGRGRASPGNVSVRNKKNTWYYGSDEHVVVRSDYEGDHRTTDTDELLDRNEVSYRGTEAVTGGEAHVVEIALSDGTDRNRPILLPTYPIIVGDEPDDGDDRLLDEQTLWIDRDHAYPLKHRVIKSGRAGERVVERTREHEEIAFNQGIDDERFTFDPPDGAERIEGERIEGDRFETVSEAEEAAPYTLPEPAVPDSYVLHEVVLTDRNGKTDAIIWYREPGPNTIMVGVFGSEQSLDGVPTQFGGVSGTLVESDDRLRFQWPCRTRQYRVAGPIDEAELASIVASIDCG